MAGTKRNAYAIGNTNFDAMMTTLDLDRRGKGSVTLTEMTTTTVPKIAAGSWIEVGGAVYEFTADETLSGSPSDGHVYIYIVPGTTTCTAVMTNTAPTWRDAKQGWYGTAGAATYRYITILIIKSGASYMKGAQNVLYTSGSINIPPWFSSIAATLSGGGGAGGGGSATKMGGGGGGGASIVLQIPTSYIISAGSASITYGAGGSGVSNDNGGDGGDTYFTGYPAAFAKGGKGGSASGGAALGGDMNVNGSRGGNASATSTYMSGGGGGGGYGAEHGASGFGGSGGTGGLAGYMGGVGGAGKTIATGDGNSGGLGAGGGGAGPDTTNRTGGNGGNGFIIILYPNIDIN